MARVIPARQLSIRDYVASLDLVPSNVYYQVVQSNNVTTAGAQWQITSPNKRSLLLSYANVVWKPTIQRRIAVAADPANTPEPWTTAGDRISFKPILPFTNAMTSQTVSFNGNSLTVAQPRRFSELFNRLCVGRGESVGCYESQWWEDGSGTYAGNRAGLPNEALNVDQGLWQNEKAMQTKFQEVTADPNGRDPGSALIGNNFVIPYEEPLYAPPFNPYAKVAGKIPQYLPWSTMSPMIPNIDRVEIDIQFNPDKLAAGALFYAYSKRDDGGMADVPGQRELVITELAADLHLWWYEVSPNMSIPRAPMIRTWNIREFQETVNGGVIVANGRNAPTANTTLLQLRSVPSAILIHARRRQDVANYVCDSWASDTDFRNTNPGGSPVAGGGQQQLNTHSIDSFMEILSMNVLLGDRPNVISTTFSQRDLYEITLGNAKYYDFSLSQTDWRGAMTLETDNPTDGSNTGNPQPTGTLQPQHAKSFVCFRAKDLAEQVSPGVFFPNSLQLEVNFRAKDGACGLQGGDHVYDIFVHILVGKHWLRIETDRGQYQEQNVPLETARRELESRGSSLLSVGGGYVSRV